MKFLNDHVGVILLVVAVVAFITYKKVKEMNEGSTGLNEE